MEFFRFVVCAFGVVSSNIGVILGAWGTNVDNFDHHSGTFGGLCATVVSTHSSERAARRNVRTQGVQKETHLGCISGGFRLLFATVSIKLCQLLSELYFHGPASENIIFGVPWDLCFIW